VTSGSAGWPRRAGSGSWPASSALTIEHVTAAELVLADGRIVRADASQNPDLLWALRGAGGNFGIVTAFELDAYPVSDVVFAQMLYDATDATGLLERWGKLVEAAPRELTSFLYMSAGQRGSPRRAGPTVWAGTGTDAAVGALTPLLSVAPVLQQAGTAPPLCRDRGAPRRHPLRRPGRSSVQQRFAVPPAPELNEGIAAGPGRCGDPVRRDPGGRRRGQRR